MEEIWKDVKGYEGLYQASNLGRIKSLYGWNGHNFIKREKILKPSVQLCGKNYKRCVVKLCGKDYKVHRVIAMTFIPNPNNLPQINHKDFNTLNNCIDNLEWCSAKDNMQWSYLYKRNSFYSYVDKNIVIELYKKGITAKNIAKKLNITPNIVYNIVSKNKISRKEYKRNSKYDISIIELKKMFNEGKKNKEIAEKYNMPKTYVARRRYQMNKGEI